VSLRFGTDGVRGRALSELSAAHVAALGRAGAQVLGGGRWLVGRDTRESGVVLERALVQGLAAAGAEPVVLGVVPTPGLAWAAAGADCPAAMITASHNPWHDNGVKLFAAGGTKLPDAVERAIESMFDPEHVDAFVHGHEIEAARSDASEHYLAHLVAGSERLDGLRLVLDCANGATSGFAPRLFRALGAQVQVLHAEPDGRNINEACGATHTESLQRAVVATDAELGLAFDGDGDRVIAVDHLGRVVDGDRLLALAALQLRERGELFRDTVVVTVMSNLGFHRAMAAAGIDVVTTAVGDRYVLEALEAGGYSLGGEQSGHIVYRELATTGDGMLAAARLAAFVHGHRRPLADLASEVMTSYPQILLNVQVAGRHPDVAEELAAEISEAAARLGGDGRVLVRASGTEPLVRVMVEAATDELARSVAEDLAAAARARLA